MMRNQEGVTILRHTKSRDKSNNLLNLNMDYILDDIMEFLLLLLNESSITFINVILGH